MLGLNIRLTYQLKCYLPNFFKHSVLLFSDVKLVEVDVGSISKLFEKAIKIK